MIKALWLTSWYPNKLDKMNGDFIQRHARAAALFCKVDVIHLEPDKHNLLTRKIEVSSQINGNLSETIVLYKLSRNIIGKLVSFIRYVLLFKKYVQQYIEVQGTPDIVHIHIPMKAGIIALWLKRSHHIPYVLTEHWTIYNDMAEDAYAKRNFLFKYYTKKILDNAAAFLPVSNHLGKAVQQMVSVVPFTVIPNVADTNFFNDAFIKEEKNIFRFVHVSTLKYQKNPEGILRAYSKFCKRFSSGQLFIVGEQPEKLIQYADTLGIPDANISFTGLVPYEQVAVILKQCNAMLMFSRFENLPCAIIEALCCGLPVISTNVGGIPEIINESNGILINSEDEDALYNAMERLYSKYNFYDNRAIAKNAQKKFSFANVGKQIEEVYSEIIAKSYGTQVK